MTRSVKNSDFAVSLHALEHHGRDPVGVRRAGPIGGLAVSTSRVPDGAEVAVDVVCELVHGGVLVTGTVSAPWVGECARCLEVAHGRVVAEVRELFERGGGPDDTTYPLGEDALDLEPMAREQCMLGLPLRPLCRTACKGLCGECGANLNEGPCGCASKR